MATLYDPIELTIPQIIRDRGIGTCRYTLDGVDYQFRWRYNQRAGRWFLSVYDTDDAAIADGIAVVCAFGLLELITDARRPPGELWIHDSANDQATPGLDALGVSARVYYYPTIEATA